MKYENRVVAFIDILGFRSLIDATTDKDNKDVESNIDNIVGAFKAIQETWNEPELSGHTESNSRKVTIFSDTIVVSFRIDDPGQVFYTLLDIKHLIMRLIYRKILCRGAVSIGKFIHTDEFLFGPGLVESYTLESKAAVYPRVILDRDIIEVGSSNGFLDHTPKEEESYVKALLEKDSDGMYYIDYFFKAQSELDDPDYDFPEYIEILGDIIRKGLMGSSHQGKADLRVKFSWMKERYNHMIDIVKKARGTDSDDVEEMDDLAQFYRSLKKINPRGR